MLAGILSVFAYVFIRVVQFCDYTRDSSRIWSTNELLIFMPLIVPENRAFWTTREIRGKALSHTGNVSDSNEPQIR